MTNPPHIKNRLLARLTPAELQRDFSDLQLVSLSLRHNLFEVGDTLNYVYFPEDSLLSVINTMANGDMVEVGMVSSEGLVGMSALLGVPRIPYQVIVQAPGSAYRIDAAHCKAVFDRNAHFRNLVLRYFEMFLLLTSQTAACNQLHSISQRCARWLLMSTDRMKSETITMTHEFLSTMLGSRRAGVTEIAGDLQRAGLIRYHHGRLTILDREGLEATSCECYRHDRVYAEKYLWYEDAEHDRASGTGKSAGNGLSHDK